MLVANIWLSQESAVLVVTINHCLDAFRLILSVVSILPIVRCIDAGRYQKGRAPQSIVVELQLSSGRFWTNNKAVSRSSLTGVKWGRYHPCNVSSATVNFIKFIPKHYGIFAVPADDGPFPASWHGGDFSVFSPQKSDVHIKVIGTTWQTETVSLYLQNDQILSGGPAIDWP
jgi:hypothetical protein